MKIFRNGVEIYDLNIDHQTVVTNRMMVENTVVLQYSSTSPLENLKIGDYFTIGDERYELNELPEVRISDQGVYAYTALFVGYIHTLDNFLMDRGDVNEKFFFFGNAKGHLDFILGKINAVSNGYSYTFDGVGVSIEPRNIDYGSMSVLSAMHKFCEVFGCEFDLQGKVFRIAKKVEQATNYIFQIGKGKGLYSIARGKLSNEKITTVMYAFGGKTNMKNDERLSLDEKKIEKNIDLYGIREEKVVFEDIYPQCNQSITSDAKRMSENSAYWSVEVATMDFDLEKCILEDPLIEFTTGNCMGIQFKIVKYNHNSKTLIFEEKSEEMNDGTTSALPNDVRKPEVGDTLHFLNILLPDSYIVAAKEELRKAAKEELERRSVPQAPYTVEVDSRFLVEKPHPRNGDLVKIVHEEIGLDATLRIVGVSYPMIESDNLRLTISDNILVSGSQSLLQTIRKDIQTAVASGVRYHPLMGNFSTPLAASEVVSPLIKNKDFDGFGFEKKGFAIGTHPTLPDQTMAVVDHLNVRKRLNVYELIINQIKHMGGKMIYSAASMEISKVEELENGERKVYFDSHEGQLKNLFTVHDLALCQRFDTNGKTPSKQYHWEVTAIGEEFVVLRPNQTYSGIAEVGDIVIQYGNTSDKERQHAYIIDVIGGARTSFVSGLDRIGATGTIVSELGFIDGRPKFVVGDSESYIRYDAAQRILEICGKVSFTGGSSGLSKLEEFLELEEKVQQAQESANQATIPQVLVESSTDQIIRSENSQSGFFWAQRVLKVGDRREVLDKKNCSKADGVQTTSSDYRIAQIALTQLTKGKRYRVSFNYSFSAFEGVIRPHINGTLRTKEIDHTNGFYLDEFIFNIDQTDLNFQFYQNWKENPRIRITTTISNFVIVEVAEVEEIDFKGRNLIKGTSDGKHWRADHGQMLTVNKGEFSWKNNLTSEKNISSAFFTIPVRNKPITVSFSAKKSPNCSGVELFIVQSNDYQVAYMTDVDATSGYQKFVFTTTIGDFDHSLFLRFDHNGSIDGNNATVWIKDIKLELGDKVTPWETAPEDATLRINEINYTPNAIIRIDPTKDKHIFEALWNEKIHSKIVPVMASKDAIDIAKKAKAEAEEAQKKAATLAYLESVIQDGSTSIGGGLVLSNLLAVTDDVASNEIRPITGALVGKMNTVKEDGKENVLPFIFSGAPTTKADGTIDFTNEELAIRAKKSKFWAAEDGTGRFSCIEGVLDENLNPRATINAYAGGQVTDRVWIDPNNSAAPNTLQERKQLSLFSSSNCNNNNTPVYDLGLIDKNLHLENPYKLKAKGIKGKIHGRLTNSDALYETRTFDWVHLWGYDSSGYLCQDEIDGWGSGEIYNDEYREEVYDPNIPFTVQWSCEALYKGVSPSTQIEEIRLSLKSNDARCNFAVGELVYDMQYTEYGGMLERPTKPYMPEYDYSKRGEYGQSTLGTKYEYDFRPTHREYTWTFDAPTIEGMVTIPTGSSSLYIYSGFSADAGDTEFSEQSIGSIETYVPSEADRPYFIQNIDATLIGKDGFLVRNYSGNSSNPDNYVQLVRGSGADRDVYLRVNNVKITGKTNSLSTFPNLALAFRIDQSKVTDGNKIAMSHKTGYLLDHLGIAFRRYDTGRFHVTGLPADTYICTLCINSGNESEGGVYGLAYEQTNPSEIMITINAFNGSLFRVDAYITVFIFKV